MGLSIDNRIGSLQALNSLRIHDRSQAKVLERIATGRSINDASDSPSGFVISEQFRSRIASLNQAVENSQNASNLVGTAEVSIGEVGRLLTDIRELIVAARNLNSPDQVAAEQASIDNALASIDLVAATTRFADSKLLDGSASIDPVSAVGSGIRSVRVHGAQFEGSALLTVAVDLQAAAERAGDVFTSGSGGTVDVSIASGAGAAEFASAVNAHTGSMAVFASQGRLTLLG